MYEVIRTVHLADTERDTGSVLERLRTVTGRIANGGAVVAPTHPGSRNGGDLLLRLRFDSAERWVRNRAELDDVLAGAEIGRVVGADLAPTDPSYTGRRPGSYRPGVYRTMLAKVHPDAPPAGVAAFERAVLQIPRHVPQIRAWRLGRVAASVGEASWTHAWEQEYDHLDGLLGAYMNHPIHWAYVDRWFDPESPLQIVRDRVVHTFCAIDEPVLTSPSS